MNHKEPMTNRNRILRTLRGQEVDRAPIWLLFPWDRTSYYADVRNIPSYAPVVESMIRHASILNRRNLDLEVFSKDFRTAFPGRSFAEGIAPELEATHLAPPTRLMAAGRFLDSEEDLDRFLTLPVQDDPELIASGMQTLLPAYLAEKAAFPEEYGAMMLDLGEPVGVLYAAANLLEYPIWSLTRRDEISAFLRRLQGHFLAKYRWCLEHELADIYFLVGSELAAPPMVNYDTFRDWIMPFQKELIDLVHSFGKLVITHFHGRIRGLLKDFLELGPDGLHTIEEPPVGDCPLEEAFSVVGDRIALIGTIQYDEFRALEPESMRKEVRRVLEIADRAVTVPEKGQSYGDTGSQGGTDCGSARTGKRRFVLSPSAGPFHPELDSRMRDNYLAFLDEGSKWRKNNA